MGPQAFLWARGSLVDSISQLLRCSWEHLPTTPTSWPQMWSSLEAGVEIQSTGSPRAGEGIGGLPLYFFSHSLVSLHELTAHLTYSYLYAFTQAVLSWNTFLMNSKFNSSFKAFVILTPNDLWSANLEISFILSYTWVHWDALCPSINSPSLFPPPPTLVKVFFQLFAQFKLIHLANSFDLFNLESKCPWNPATS